MDDNRIKPCPFCGKAAAFVPSHDFYLIGCINPDCMHVEMRDKSAEKAIKRWNRRMVEDELQDALNGMRGIAQQRLERVRELEAQLEWEPLEAGMATILKGLERYQRQIGRAAIQGWYKPDAVHGEVAYIEVLINALRGSEDAPPTLKLFRRRKEAGE